MLGTVLADWYVLPRNVVPSTAATATTRTNPVMRDTAVSAVIAAVERASAASPNSGGADAGTGTSPTTWADQAAAAPRRVRRRTDRPVPAATPQPRRRQ